MKSVALITDGACLGNPGPGGWAALLRYGQHEKVLTGYEVWTTNNRMEISAVLFGLKLLKEPCQVQITSDSKYVIHAFEQGWLREWKINGWRNSSGKEVANRDLWEQLAAEVSKHKIKWQWVKGHNGHVDNERVDEAARLAALEAQDRAKQNE